MDKRLTIRDPWTGLRAFTDARIALGRAGGSMPTASLIELRSAQARARDAVYVELAAANLGDALNTRGYETLMARSAAGDRATYLRRPDLGRRLDDASRVHLAEACRRNASAEVCFVLADGLSASAVHRHAIPLLNLLMPQCWENRWDVAPI